MVPLLWLAACAEPPAAPEPARNLLVICLDTVRHDAFFNPRLDDALTPWLARAQDYAQADSVAPWTIPSVATVFTGWYPVQHRAGGFVVAEANLERDLPNVLSENATTLAETLAAAGFRTGAFSGHAWLEAETGLEQGFRQVHSRIGRDAVLQRFEPWLDAPASDRRWFGYLHFMEAHDWHLAPPIDLARRLDALAPTLRAELLADASPAACVEPESDICLRNQVYLLGVRHTRETLARVLGLLQARGRLTDTLVLMYSDHGEEFWEHREAHLQRGDPRGTPGYGHGHSLYQELLHVPLLAWVPGVDGARHETPVSLVDVLPTLLDWLGLPPSPDRLPGQPLPRGPSSAPPSFAMGERSTFASGIAYGPEAVSVRQGALKSIFQLSDESRVSFDLQQDPLERSALDDPQLTVRFDGLTGDYLELDSPLPVERIVLSPEEIERLQAIGYLQGYQGEPEPPPPDD